jgi:dTDP-4-dehydrorhamnose 3,5-epimerase-like enzyme
VLSEIAHVLYPCFMYCDPPVERGFNFDDAEGGIAWPTQIQLDVSARDRAARSLSAIAADVAF